MGGRKGAKEEERERERQQKDTDKQVKRCVLLVKIVKFTRGIRSS